MMSTGFRLQHTSHKDIIIQKFADDTAVIGRINGGDEAAYRREVASLVTWCEDNNLINSGHEEGEENSSATVHPRA
ncbi:hypothetical protein QTP86_021364 [Hemibagrus guttatus]|nr:hypothetical protein QTP86_021364 [Hemibagrus guttatus]